MIRVEVSGDSIPEVADKLLALGHGLRSQHSYEADDAARSVPQPPGYAAAEDAPKVKATRKAKEPEPEPEEQVDPEPLAGQTERVEPGLDFDKDVAPVVLDAVAAVGKDKVIGLIGQFGAARASEVPPAQWPELIALLKDAK